MINFNMTEEEAKIIFAALNNYRIQQALSLMDVYPQDKITNDDLLKELDSLIETLYYKIPIDKLKEL